MRVGSAKTVKSLLDTLAASGQPKMWELPPTEARKMALGLTQMVEGKEPIGELENGSLPGVSGPLPFRIYTPVAVAAEPHPCIVYFHGGAFLDLWQPSNRRHENGEGGLYVRKADYQCAAARDYLVTLAAIQFRKFLLLRQH